MILVPFDCYEIQLSNDIKTIRIGFVFPEKSAQKHIKVSKWQVSKHQTTHFISYKTQKHTAEYTKHQIEQEMFKRSPILDVINVKTSTRS